MPSITQIICQPYRLDKSGHLRPDTAIHCSDAAVAQRRASRLIENGRAVGVDVVRQTVDENLGDYGEPEFLGRHGQVPTPYQ